MNVAEYIIDYIEKKGVNTVFMITGGQAMFLNDAIYKSKKITPVFHHHEQAAGMAAEAFGRSSGTLGVAMVTAGPAGVNVLNGVVGAYTDSSPMMILSGQSSSSNVAYMEKTGIRQYGLQGIYMEPMASAVTKYYVSIRDPARIRYHLEKAYYLAFSGRPGPVWIDVPLDMQRMSVPTKFTHMFTPDKTTRIDSELPELEIGRIITLISNAKRPLFIAGHGLGIAGANDIFKKFLKLTKMPVLTTRLGIDLVASDNRYFVGRPGLYGDRAANAAVQLADVIIAVGARLDPGIIGYEAGDWGRRAIKIIVDIDEKELEKPGLEPSIRIHADAKEFLTLIVGKLSGKKLASYSRWVKHCTDARKKYPACLPLYKSESSVNSYYLSERLSYYASPKDSIVVDTSSPFHVVCQAWQVKSGQKFLTTGGISTMGYWPAGIGVAMARPKGNTIIITGDGCLQMNLQELATLKQNMLPIKLFVINNDGYLLIRHTQKTHMEGRLLGESPQTGLYIPDSIKIAQAYGIKAIRISTPGTLESGIREALAYRGPVVIDVVSPHWQPVVPRVASDKAPDGRLIAKPYEDLFPFLPREELNELMKFGDTDA